MSDGLYDQVALWSQVLGSVGFIVVLVVIFRRFVAPAVRAAEAAKNAALVDAESRAKLAATDVDAARAELSAVAGRVSAIEAQSARDAETERARILGDAHAEADRLVRGAQGELGRARLAAAQNLRASILERALEIARSSAARSIDAAGNAALVDRVVQTLDDPQAMPR